MYGTMKSSLLSYRLALVTLAISAAGLLLSCKRKVKSFAGAYASLKQAVRKRECDALFGLLDQKGEWAAMSLVRDANEIARLVKDHYPAHLRERELARIGGAAAADARSFVAGLCRRSRVLEGLDHLLQKPQKVASSSKEGLVITASGQRIRFSRDQYGKWGCDILTERLERRKHRMANLLKLTRENASVYRGQKGR